jgi:chemotaxis protein MotB
MRDKAMRDFISFRQEQEHNDATGNSRWMVSYADFMTLLFVLFLVLYAKLPKHPEPNTPVAADLRTAIIPGIRPHRAAVKPVIAAPDTVEDRQQMLLQELARTFTDLVQDGDITLETRENGVLLDIKDSALFASGTAEPAQQANSIVTKISAILAENNNKIVVEGHTDSVPIRTAQFPSNWELSSARAASIVRALQERGISANRMEASGLAETKPKSSNDTAQGRSENRRVSLLVLND